MTDHRDRVRAYAREHYLPALYRGRRSRERSLLAVVLCLLRPDGTASLDAEFLAHVTGLPRRKVFATIAELERFGMLERTRTRSRNTYSIPLATSMSAANGNGRRPVVARDAVPGPGTTPSSARGLQRKDGRPADENEAVSDARERERASA